jgi:hypothetical protein
MFWMCMLAVGTMVWWCERTQAQDCRNRGGTPIVGYKSVIYCIGGDGGVPE